MKQSSILRTTWKIVRHSLFPGEPPKLLAVPPDPLLILRDDQMDRYSHLLKVMSTRHAAVEILFPPMLRWAGFFIAVRLKHDGFTFRIVQEGPNLRAIINR